MVNWTESVKCGGNKTGEKDKGRVDGTGVLDRTQTALVINLMLSDSGLLHEQDVQHLVLVPIVHKLSLRN